MTETQLAENADGEVQRDCHYDIAANGNQKSLSGAAEKSCL